MIIITTHPNIPAMQRTLTNNFASFIFIIILSTWP